MAIKARNTSDVVRFVFDDDPGIGTPDETVFLLRIIPTREFAKLRDMGMSMRRKTSQEDDGDVGDLEIDVTSNESALDYVRRGLDGWENYLDHDGSILAWDSKSWALPRCKPLPCITDALLDKLDHDHMMGLAEEIAKINTVGAQEVKNSSGSDTLTDSSTTEKETVLPVQSSKK